MKDLIETRRARTPLPPKYSHSQSRGHGPCGAKATQRGPPAGPGRPHAWSSLVPGWARAEKARLTSCSLPVARTASAELTGDRSGETECGAQSQPRSCGGGEAAGPATLCGCEAQPRTSGGWWGGGEQRHRPPPPPPVSHRTTHGRRAPGPALMPARASPQPPPARTRGAVAGGRLPCDMGVGMPSPLARLGTASRPGRAGQCPEPAERHSPRAVSGRLSRVTTGGPGGQSWHHSSGGVPNGAGCQGAPDSGGPCLRRGVLHPHFQQQKQP